MSDLAIMTIKKKVSDDWFTLFALGDLHIGQKATDEDAIEETVKYISKKNVKNTGVILTGDLIENVLPTSKGDLFEMAHPDPRDQIKVVVDLLKPIKKYILMMVDGNHEHRTTKASGISPTEMIADKLNLPYVGYRGMLCLQLIRKGKVQEYMIYGEHGAGAIPKKVGGRYNKLAQSADKTLADIYIQGHIHHKLVFDKRIWKRVGNKMMKRKVVFASNGSYLMEAEYALRSGFDPTEPGVARLELNTAKYNIHASI